MDVSWISRSQRICMCIITIKYLLALVFVILGMLAPDFALKSTFPPANSVDQALSFRAELSIVVWCKSPKASIQQGFIIKG